MIYTTRPPEELAEDMANDTSLAGTYAALRKAQKVLDSAAERCHFRGLDQSRRCGCEFCGETHADLSRRATELAKMVEDLAQGVWDAVERGDAPCKGDG